MPLLPLTDSEVAKDVRRVDKGVALSPVLLVRGDIDTNRTLVIADRYHRVCAGHHLKEDSEVGCRVVDLPATTV